MSSPIRRASILSELDDRGVEIQVAGLQELLAAEGEVAGASAAAARSPAARMSVTPSRSAPGGISSRRRLGGAVDDRHQVVEVVSNAAGELTGWPSGIFWACWYCSSSFRRAVMSWVTPTTVTEACLGIEVRRRAREHPADLAVDDQPVLHLARGPGARGLPGRPDPRQIFPGWMELAKSSSSPLLCCQRIMRTPSGGMARPALCDVEAPPDHVRDRLGAPGGISSLLRSAVSVAL